MSTKNKKTSTALALPTMAPPVKKAEVAEALYLLALEKHTEKQKERSLRRDELQKQWEEALAPLMTNPTRVRFQRPNNWDTHEITITVKLTTRLKKIGEQYENNFAEKWEEKFEREKIKEILTSAGGRAKDLLTDPASRAALEQMLSQIGA